MRVPLAVLLLAYTTYAFRPPKIEVEERQLESHHNFGQFVELREHERLILRCHGRFDDLTFKFPNLEGNLGYEPSNFQDRVQEEIDEGNGDTILTINDVRESDTGTYSCVSEEHPSLNDTVHVFVHGSKIFLPLKSVMFFYDNGDVIVPCKTTEFVDRNDIELYANGALIKSASKNFDQRVGFKITDKLYPEKPINNVKFECKHTKKPQQEVSYIISEKTVEENVDTDYQFYWDKGFDWPHVGYNYSLTCHLKGSKIFDKWKHRLHIECDRCSNDNTSHVYVENHKAVNNEIYVRFSIEHLELEDDASYKCIWEYENHEDKSIDYHLHVAPMRPQIKIIERSPQYLKMKENRRTSLTAKFAVYPSDEENYVATWSRTYNSSIKGVSQSETIITDEIRTISSMPLSNGAYLETLDLSSAAMTTSKSGTYRLSITHMNTSQSVQWEVAIENDKPDVQITVREPSSFNYFDQQFYAPDTHLHIDCVSISIPPSTNVILQQKNKATGEFREIDRSELMEMEGTFEKRLIWNMTLVDDAELRCISHRNGEKYIATKSVIIGDEAIRVSSKTGKSEQAMPSEDSRETYEGDHVNLTCAVPTGASDWDVSWRFKNDDLSSLESYSVGHTKHVVLKIRDITSSQSGKYSCVVKKGDSESIQDITVKVESISTPYHIDAESRTAVSVEFDDTFELKCGMTGTPLPEYRWYKDGVPYTSGDAKDDLLKVMRARAEDDGQFECRAQNRAGTTSKFIEVQVDGVPKGSVFFYWFLALFIFCLVVFICLLFLKLRASRRITKQKDIALNELYKSMLEHNAGPLPENMKDLPIEERTYYLPYNTSYEIDPANLEVGEALGVGHFGVVRKGLLQMADPRSEIEAKTQLQVAVKSSTNPYNVEVQQMMAEELKIMSAIPKHPNVLSLVGAVTTNIRKGQILIVTEYVECGSVEIFLRKHRNVFVNELVEEDQPVDDSYMVPNSVTKKKQYKIDVNSGEGDHLLHQDGISLCTSDLLSIGLQIANGMEWLANIPCVHRDLAGRNVLITRQKIIRIADFGLAKRHNEKNYYRTKKSNNTPVPIKWMAQEAFEEAKFTQKSDVWAFGICLYEVFSLGGKPYPNVDNSEVMEYVKSGQRNKQPPYCHDDIYELMKKCWETSPKDRPTFSECVHYLKEHMKGCAPELLEKVDNMLHTEKEDQLKLGEWTKKNRSGGVTGIFQKKPARRQQPDERYLIVESHA